MANDYLYSNCRKIVIRNIPPEVTCDEIADCFASHNAGFHWIVRSKKAASKLEEDECTSVLLVVNNAEALEEIANVCKSKESKVYSDKLTIEYAPNPNFRDKDFSPLHVKNEPYETIESDPLYKSFVSQLIQGPHGLIVPPNLKLDLSLTNPRELGCKEDKPCSKCARYYRAQLRKKKSNKEAKRKAKAIEKAKEAEKSEKADGAVKSEGVVNAEDAENPEKTDKPEKDKRAEGSDLADQANKQAEKQPKSKSRKAKKMSKKAPKSNTKQDIDVSQSDIANIDLSNNLEGKDAMSGLDVSSPSHLNEPEKKSTGDRTTEKKLPRRKKKKEKLKEKEDEKDKAKEIEKDTEKEKEKQNKNENKNKNENENEKDQRIIIEMPDGGILVKNATIPKSLQKRLLRRRHKKKGGSAEISKES